MINKVILVGRTGKEPEIRYTAGGTALAKFSVATSEKQKDEEKTEWHNVVAWGKTAEFLEKYGYKGQLLYCEGKIQTRSWDDKEGNKRYTTEVVVQTVKALSWKNDGGNKQDNEPPDDHGPVGDGNFDDDDVPF